MEIPFSEVCRYLGYGGNTPDERTDALIRSCMEELENEAVPRCIYREFLLEMNGAEIKAGALRTKSRNLTKNLRDCGSILIFAATLGSGPDRLIAKYGHFMMSRAVTLQAASAAMIEAYCNEECKKLAAEYRNRDLFLRPRFSPGYGDFPLTCQSAILEMIEAGKRIGIKLTDSLLMTPSKSVSAVIGISEKPTECRTEGCEICSKRNCAYRRPKV